MNKKTAQRLADSAIQFQLAQLARKIAALPDDQISAASPEIQELKEFVASLDGGSVVENRITPPKKPR